MPWIRRQLQKTRENVKIASIMSKPMSLVYPIVIIIIAAAAIFAIYKGGVWAYDHLAGKTGEPVTVEQNGQQKQGDYSEVGSGESTEGEEVISPSLIDASTPETSPVAGSVVPNTGPQPE